MVSSVKISLPGPCWGSSPAQLYKLPGGLSLPPRPQECEGRPKGYLFSTGNWAVKGPLESPSPDTSPSCALMNQVISALLLRAASPAGALVAPQCSAEAVPCCCRPTEPAYHAVALGLSNDLLWETWNCAAIRCCH